MIAKAWETEFRKVPSTQSRIWPQSPALSLGWQEPASWPAETCEAAVLRPALRKQ